MRALNAGSGRPLPKQTERLFALNSLRRIAGTGQTGEAQTRAVETRRGDIVESAPSEGIGRKEQAKCDQEGEPTMIFRVIGVADRDRPSLRTGIVSAHRCR